MYEKLCLRMTESFKTEVIENTILHTPVINGPVNYDNQGLWKVVLVKHELWNVSD